MTDILIVDDDPVFGELTLERFESSPWKAAFHAGPFGTINALRAMHPRLILLDVNMPGLAGTRMGDLIRRTPGLRSMRILLFSSMDQRELEALVDEFGADGALHKSATRDELFAAVAPLVGDPEPRIASR